MALMALPKDTINEILLNLPLYELKYLCRSNKQVNIICHNEDFWRERFKRDYPSLVNLKPNNSTWSTYYSEIGESYIDIESYDNSDTWDWADIRRFRKSIAEQILERLELISENSAQRHQDYKVYFNGNDDHAIIANNDVVASGLFSILNFISDKYGEMMFSDFLCDNDHYGYRSDENPLIPVTEYVLYIHEKESPPIRSFNLNDKQLYQLDLWTLQRIKTGLENYKVKR